MQVFSTKNFIFFYTQKKAALLQRKPRSNSSFLSVIFTPLVKLLSFWCAGYSAVFGFGVFIFVLS